MKLPAGESLIANALQLAAAAGQLFLRLSKGTYTVSGKERPLNFDYHKVYHADGISQDETRLLRQLEILCASFSGTQHVRRRIGHGMFGYRATHGDGLFVTISPGRRHSSLTLRLARARRDDPLLHTDREMDTWRHRCGKDKPAIFSDCADIWERGISDIELPSLAIRQGLNAREPLSSVLHYDVSVRVILAFLAGVRMCARCPHCSEHHHRWQKGEWNRHEQCK